MRHQYPIYLGRIMGTVVMLFSLMTITSNHIVSAAEQSNAPET